MRRWSRGLLSAFAVLGLMHLPSAYAGWLGLTVHAELVPAMFPSVITSQFLAPQTVGPGVEFQGRSSTGEGYDWTITVDVGDNTITVAFTEPTNPDAAFDLPHSWNAVAIDVGGLTEATGMTLLSYSCVPAGSVACLSVTDSAKPFFGSLESVFNVGFNTVRNGDTYVFGFSRAVAEPDSLLLALLAFTGIGIARRHRLATG